MQFAKTPEDRIGMLFWHMHRCARIIFSLNYHTSKWTPQQCIDFLEETKQERIEYLKNINLKERGVMKKIANDWGIHYSAVSALIKTHYDNR